MTAGASTAGVDVDRIAAAVGALPCVAGLHSGRFGDIATLLPGRRVAGVRVRPGEVTVGVIGRYPGTAAGIGEDIRTALGPLGRPVHVHICDITADSPDSPDSLGGPVIAGVPGPSLS